MECVLDQVHNILQNHGDTPNTSTPRTGVRCRDGPRCPHGAVFGDGRALDGASGVECEAGLGDIGASPWLERRVGKQGRPGDQPGFVQE